jgi:hypothetical protein
MSLRWGLATAWRVEGMKDFLRPVREANDEG